MWSGMPGKAQRFGGHGINKYAYKDGQRQAIKKKLLQNFGGQFWVASKTQISV